MYVFQVSEEVSFGACTVSTQGTFEWLHPLVHQQVVLDVTAVNQGLTAAGQRTHELAISILG